MPKYNETKRVEALATLRGWGLKPGDTIYCVLRHVSKSGMLRIIDLVYYVNDDVHDLRHIGHVAAQALGTTYDRKREGIRVGGCGMDMGFHVVYELSHALWRDGFECAGDGSGVEGSGVRCPSNDHSNGDRDYTPHLHSDGGYALKHRWL